jgi:hypothetical protein
MRGARRLLCIVILLASAGCRSIPTGSTGFADRFSEIFAAPAANPAQEEGLAALIASRRGAREDRQQQDPSQPAATPRRWESNEVLRKAVETELAGATPEEREQFLQRLAGADDEEVARLLNQKRQARRAAISTPPNMNARAPSESSAQPVILTRRPESSPTVVQASSSPAATAPSELQPSTSRRTHPLLEDSSQLAAPAPGGGRHSVSRQAAPAPTIAEDPQRPAVPVFDAFGTGGESLAAQQELAAASRIEMAGRHTLDAPQTQAEAIARNLDSEQAAQSVYWQEDLDKLITLLETQLAQQKPGSTDLSQDRYIRQHVALRMLYLIASRRPEALQAIPSVPHDRQEFWTRMFWAMSSIFDEEAMPNSTVRAAETIAQLRAAIEQIEPRASLELRGTVFCRQINGFGDFVTFADEPFIPGQPVLIYTEVRNFQSQASGEADYRTVLRSTITIQQENVSGPVVFKYELPETEDRCQSRRSDYFHSYRIHLPENLKPGPHVLTLDITDMLTGKNGSTTLNFVVR